MKCFRFSLIAATLFSCFSTHAAPDLECLLRGSCIETKNVLQHLQELQNIAENNDGNRSAGSSGHELSANYIAQQLLAANYQVTLLPFKFVKFSTVSSSVLADNVALEIDKDFSVMSYSGSGLMQSKLAAVDLQLGAGNQTTSGCEAEDFSDFLKDANPVNKVRFAWFSAEEVGPVGSTRYVESLSEAEKHKISLYINVDMIGSPNFKISVFDGDGSKYGQKGPEGSAQIEAKFHEIFRTLGVESIETELNGRSDYAAFSAAGIPVGGVFTGAEGVMSEEEAVLFGGKAGVAYDSCYHKACDSIANINERAIELNANALAAAMISFSNSVEELASVSKSATSGMRNRVVFPKHLHCHEDVYDQ